MIRILERGGIVYNKKTLPDKKLKICCGECNCTFICEGSDLQHFVKPFFNDNRGQNVVLSIDCPECEATNIIPRIGQLGKKNDSMVFAFGTGVDFLTDEEYTKLCEEVDAKKKK